MKISELLKKLGGTLSEEDLVNFEDAISKMVTEKAELRVEEEKKKIELQMEEKGKKDIETKVEEAKKALQEDFDNQAKDLEEKLVNTLDKFLESEINEKISDETLNKVAISETYKPIVNGIIELIEQKFVALDTEGHGLVREAKEEIEKKEDELSTIMSEKMDLKEENQTLKVKLLISEKTDGLTEDQKKRVTEMFEDKDYKEACDKINSFIEIVSEKDESDNNDNDDEPETNVNEDVNAEQQTPEEEKSKSKDDDKTDEEILIESVGKLFD